VARAGALNAAEYLSEETRLLATPLDCEDFSLAVDELRDAAERLDKRLAHLEGRLAGRTHR
jgi:ubiquinone biosynthesis protein UbiJ